MVVGDQLKVIANSSNCIAGIAHEKNQLYGVQFHPEVSTFYITFPITLFGSIIIIFQNNHELLLKQWNGF